MSVFLNLFLFLDIQNDYLLKVIKVIWPALISKIGVVALKKKKKTEWDGTLIICKFKLKILAEFLVTI